MTLNTPSMLLSSVDSLAETLMASVRANSIKITPKDASLDYRCGEFFISKDFIATDNFKTFSLYAILAQVEPQYLIGDFAVYSLENERVSKIHSKALEVITSNMRLVA